MFDGKEFIDVANQLQSAAPSSSHPEAFYRSAIGRAYYACFLTCREKFFPPQKWGRSDASHRAVRKVVSRRAKGSVSSWFDTLKELREHSDYHTWPASAKSGGGVQPHCECQWNASPDVNCSYALGLARKLLQRLTTTT